MLKSDGVSNPGMIKNAGIAYSPGIFNDSC